MTDEPEFHDDPGLQAIADDGWGVELSLMDEDQERRHAEHMEKVREYEREHPFVCECRRRFKAERGLKTHQRSCWKLREQQEGE